MGALPAWNSRQLARKMKNQPNKGVQGTLHKVSGPLTPDVGRKNE